MTVREMIDKYHIKLVVDGDKKKLFIHPIYAPKVQRDGVLDELKAHKDEIIEAIEYQNKIEREAYEARQKKIAAIPGLEAIKAAIEDMEKWQDEFERSFEGEFGGYNVRPRPNYDINKMLKENPQAAAYLKAEKYANKVNYELSEIGKRALDRVIEGDWEAAISDLDREISEFVQHHIYD